jgi:hypothetical protein
LPGGTDENHVNPLRNAGVQAKKRTRGLLNMMQEYYQLYYDIRPTGREVYIRKADIMNRPK